ncbi:aspartate/glutamate racemase family protein [Rhizobium sp. 21-4511-3d]
MPMMAFLHTVPALTTTFDSLQQKYLPAWERFHAADESLLQNTVKTGVLSDKTRQRLAQMIFSLEDAGADSIVVTCSTLGEAVDTIGQLCGAKLFRIDEGMAWDAVSLGRRIGVLATLPTTLGPTRRLIEKVAREGGSQVAVKDHLCPGAFERLTAGDREGHDALVLEGYRALVSQSDVIVLAQASMARVFAKGAQTSDIPVLNSIDTGMSFISKRLAAQGTVYCPQAEGA